MFHWASIRRRLSVNTIRLKYISLQFTFLPVSMLQTFTSDFMGKSLISWVDFILFVVVSELPAIEGSQDLMTVSTKLGEEFALNCTETKLVKNPIFVWSVGTCQLKQEQTGRKTSFYSVDKVGWKDGGIYTCTVLNPDHPSVSILQDGKTYRVNGKLVFGLDN